MRKPEPSEAALPPDVLRLIQGGAQHSTLAECVYGIQSDYVGVDHRGYCVRVIDAALREARAEGVRQGHVDAVTITEADKALRKAEAEVARLRGCLRAYGAHDDDCQAVGQHDPYHDDCDCGLHAALEAHNGQA